MEKVTQELPAAIGPYAVLQNLGKGGMGEVFLAKDPVCGRSVALKRIRPELRDNKTIQSRFLREARVASVLSHPSIVPILAIQGGPPEIYYTMPFVEGETLRQILRTSREQEKSGEPLHSIGKSISSLARIFLQVCEAIAYTHAKGILHRDLKPENIIVGKFGEVMILDWGIADFIDQIEKEEPLSVKKIAGSEDLTRPGKITGTLAYMAPERLLGHSSSVQTDIYALGVILYQMLTLQLPFQRKTIATFRKSVKTEELIDPIAMSPYRDIPHQLSRVCHKCLARKVKDRYQSVGELIHELKNFIEGRPQWILTAELDLHRKEDWQFQENILLAKHIAITRSLDVTEWAALMVSKKHFANNMRLEVDTRLGTNGQGIGFLLGVPEADERKSLEEGYCLWINSHSCQLFRNNVQVMEAKTLFLQPGTWHQIWIEKIDDHLKFYLDGTLKLNFASHLPLAGNHVGLLHKDGDFELENLKIYDGSHNLMVGCLAVPNALLGQKLYDVALQEYRRIGQCFPGRMEGREALFRAGLTLLEKARARAPKDAPIRTSPGSSLWAPSLGWEEKSEKLYSLALKEFEKLISTPGAPLEYLGKSLVYEALGDNDEEAKCLELSLRKFPKHPLASMLKEHIVYRMHESSLNNRNAAYRIILLAIRHIPDLFENSDTRLLIESLEKNWEVLPFIQENEDRVTQLAIQLSFWLGKAPMIVEIAKNLLKRDKVDETLLNNALFCLLELGANDALKEFLPRTPLCASLTSKLPETLDKNWTRTLHYHLRDALKNSQFKLFDETALKLRKYKISKQERMVFDGLEVWSLLIQKKFGAAGELLKKYSPRTLNQENSPLHFPYGTWLYLTEGREKGMRHFASVLDTPYPPTTALPSLFLTGRIDNRKEWTSSAFWWEKKELHRQLDLFYRSVGKV